MAALLIACLASYAQKNDMAKIFETYQDMDGITSVNIAKPMFSLLSKLKLEDGNDETVNNIKPMLSAINSFKLIVVDNPNKTDSTGKLLNSPLRINTLMQLKEQINSTVKKLNYMELMTVNSKGKKIKFLTENSDGNIINNLLLAITGDDTNMLMFLDGKIAMSDVNKFIASENKEN